MIGNLSWPLFNGVGRQVVAHRERPGPWRDNALALAVLPAFVKEEEEGGVVAGRGGCMAAP